MDYIIELLIQANNLISRKGNSKSSRRIFKKKKRIISIPLLSFKSIFFLIFSTEYTLTVKFLKNNKNNYHPKIIYNKNNKAIKRKNKVIILENKLIKM
jgi:hypothetical protein